MGRALLCDGCGSVAEALEPKGKGLAFEYCAACAPKVDAFLQAMDLLHTNLARDFEAGRRQLIERAQSQGLKALPYQ